MIAVDGELRSPSGPLPWEGLPKDRWFHLYLEFTHPLAKDETIFLFGNDAAQFLRGKLAAIRVFNAALSLSELYADQNMLGHQKHELKKVAGPRFWQPTEPVVLLAGESVEPTTRHGADGRLSDDNSLHGQITTVSNYPIQKADFPALLAAIENLKGTAGEKIGYDTWTRQPWHPFILDWEVELFPLSDGGNLSIDNRNYDASFLHTNYTLEENQPELKLQAKKSVVQAAAFYRGRSILTPYAKKQLINTITDHLDHLKQEDCYQVMSALPDNQPENYATKLTDWHNSKPAKTASAADYKNWYLTKPVYSNGIIPFSEAFKSEKERLSDVNYAIIQSYAYINSRHFISQALSGFNNALLMHHQTLQLPVADPLGFEDYLEFTGRVRKVIGSNTNLAPLPLNDFLPIRSGMLRIHRLQIIDSFGQSQMIDTGAPTKAEPMMLPPSAELGNVDAATDSWLAPRLVQPARLNFRWLAAHNGLQELNTHPESTPICGWLLANHLDNSLAVYDHTGAAIGIIDQEARWRAVPGTDLPVDLENIANQALQNVIRRLALMANEEDPANTKGAFLQDFITVTNRALENIDPEGFAHHQELALLMGRPLSIVRASVGLELKGIPAIHHGWSVFHQDLTRSSRETDEFEKVKIPIRIGERGQLNDGVLGYWKEDEALQLEAVYHTTVAAGLVNNPCIQSYEEGPSVSLSLADAADTLTLLIDPRAEVHGTTGILPAKSIHLPKDLYAQALKKINITFLSAPILMGENESAIPLPSEMGYEWSWLARDRFSWVEVGRSGALRRDTVLRTFSNGAAIWQELLRKGWITEIGNGRASIVPIDQRAGAILDAPINAQVDQIQQLLDASHLTAPDVNASFQSKQIIKEGWLRLSPSK